MDARATMIRTRHAGESGLLAVDIETVIRSRLKKQDPSLDFFSARSGYDQYGLRKRNIAVACGPFPSQKSLITQRMNRIPGEGSMNQCDLRCARSAATHGIGCRKEDGCAPKQTGKGQEMRKHLATAILAIMAVGFGVTAHAQKQTGAGKPPSGVAACQLTFDLNDPEASSQSTTVGGYTPTAAALTMSTTTRDCGARWTPLPATSSSI